MISKAMRSLSVRLQSVAFFLSVVGVAFGIKSYIQIRDEFGAAASLEFYQDLLFQIAIAFAVNIAVGIVLYRVATRPIRHLRDRMLALSQDELDVDIEYTGDRTEIGSMARNLQGFKQVLRERGERTARDALAQATKEKRQRELESCIKTFETEISTGITGSSQEVGQIADSSGNVLKAAAHTQDCVGKVQAAVGSTSENTHAVAAAAEELSASIREILHQATYSSGLSGTAVQQTEEADVIVRKLTQVATEVGTVVTLISEIAAQINLLALNASIEAARAGDAGKGFAVVASEVKNLAGETTKATERIAGQIHQIQGVSQHVATALASVRATIGDINAVSGSIASAVEEQGAATSEIARNVQNVTLLVTDIAGRMDDVKRAACETDEASTQVDETTRRLSAHFGRMEETTRTFLAKIAE